jgi:class 3 adenylate cyclase
MFCDLVDSTMLSAHLDPEELRTVVQGYQAACAAIIERYAGSIAQYLGDGLLVYFGYPAAHEDDAARAVRAALAIVGIIHELPLPNTQLPHPLRVRIGIHTGLVVVGEMGGGAKRELLALGETPNLAARLQSLAIPNTVVLSTATYRLIEGYFTCQSLGAQTLKGVPQLFEVYKVLGESGAQSRFEVAVTTGLTPLVGREEEVELLLKRWEQAQEGAGQVVLLSGEPGIGKSCLLQALKERIAAETYTRLECRCSPYYQNSAFYRS